MRTQYGSENGSSCSLGGQATIPVLSGLFGIGFGASARPGGRKFRSMLGIGLMLIS